MITVITMRDQIRTVAKRWDEQYFRRGKWYDDKSRAISERLHRLDPETATPADVAAIIGNQLWADPMRCDCCGVDVIIVVQVGEEPDYESATASLCIQCAADALAAIIARME